MAIEISLPEFNDLGHSVTTISRSMDHFVYQMSTFSEKMKKIYRLEVWFFSRQKHHRFPFFLGLRLSVRQFQLTIPEGLGFVKRWKYLELLTQRIHLYKILLG